MVAGVGLSVVGFATFLLMPQFIEAAVADLDASRLAAREEVVVVTINYRLGPFGWFHHPAITRANMIPTGQFAHTGDPGTGRHHELPPWRPWAESKQKIIFNNDGVGTEGGLIDGPALLEALWANPDLSPEQKCAVFLDDTMYPAYPLKDLAAHHCPY